MKAPKTVYYQHRIPMLCLRCGKPLKQPHREDKLYCSSTCRVAAWRKAHAS